jgi:putative hydrolase of the HAD superfamily
MTESTRAPAGGAIRRCRSSAALRQRASQRAAPARSTPPLKVCDTLAGMRGKVYEAVFFDVGGTLIAPSPSLPEVYRRALVPLGIDVDNASFRQAAAATWMEFDALVGRGRDRYTHFPGGERAYWLRYVTEVLAKVGRADRAEEAEPALHAAFSEPSAWRIFPEVRAVLGELRSRGYRLGIISNWDSRLRPLLGLLELTAEFESITVSCEVGAEKPASTIFENALSSLGVSPERAFHVGDDLVSDYTGAKASGIDAALLQRAGTPAAVAVTVSDLGGLLDLVRGASSAAAGGERTT